MCTHMLNCNYFLQKFNPLQRFWIIYFAGTMIKQVFEKHIQVDLM